jgi:hypothetical protein
MSYRPFRNIGRSLLAACAVSVLTASLCAQTAPSPTATGSPNPSRWDVFMGFSYMGSHGVVQPAGLKFDSVNLGVIGSGAYWFNKYVGAEGVFIGNPDGNPNGDGPGGDAFYGGYAGPIFRAPMTNFTLFAHALAGGVRGSGPNNNAPAATEHEPWTWGPSVMAGGGMDYDLPWFKHRFGIRLFEADYRFIHLNYNGAPGGALGGRANLGAAELSSGILMHFGSIMPPPPIAYACSVTAPTGTINAGDPVTITGTATNVLPKKTPEYSWSGDGGAKGSSNVLTLTTAAIAPGGADASYTVKGHVSDDGMKPGRFADCSVTFAVKAPPLPPPPPPPAPKPTPKPPAPPAPPAPKPTAKALCSIGFNNDPKRPVRVDNEAKACLDDITLNAQRDPSAKLAIVGNSAVKPAKTKAATALAEKAALRAASERAYNEKVYLVQEKGVDASRISLYTGSTGTNVDNTTLIPAGASFDTSSYKALPDKPVPAKKAPVKKAPAKKAPAKPATKAPAKPATKKPVTPATK